MTGSVEDATSDSEYCSPRVARQSAMHNPSSIGLRRSERICSKGKILASLEDATSDSEYCAPGVARQSVVNIPGSIGLRRSGCVRSKGVQGDKQTISLKEKMSVTSVTDVELRKPSLQQLLTEAACNFINPVEECNAEGIQFGTTLGPNSSKQNLNDIAQPINSPILSGRSNIHSGDFGRVDDELVARIPSRACDRHDQTNPSTRSQEPVKDPSPTEIAINAGFADKGTSRTIGDSFSVNRISLNFTHDDVEMTEGCTSRLLGIEISAEVPGNTFVSAMALAKPSDVLTSMPPSQETEKTPPGTQSQEFLQNSTPQERGKTNILTPVGMQSTDISAGSTQSIGGSVLHLASAFDEDGTSPASDNSIDQSVGPYFVSPAFAPTLAAIIKTHGDIAKDCPLTSNRMISCALERMCKAFCDLQEIRFTDLRSCHLQSLKAAITDAEFLKLNVAWLSKRHDELLEAVRLIKEYKAMKADRSKKRKAYASAKKTLISKKTELLAQRFEVQRLEGQIESMTRETGNLDVAIDTVTSTCKRLRDNSLMDGLL